MTVLGLDPGPTESALVVWDGQTVAGYILPNLDILNLLGSYKGSLVIEQITGYGMNVGMETFETIFWTGRFYQGFLLSNGTANRLSRRDVKLHLCETARATDANVRDALLHRFGGRERAIGKRKTPGPLYGLRSHMWAALAVAVTWADQQHANLATALSEA